MARLTVDLMVSTSDVEIEELLRRCARQERAALSLLYQREAARMIGVAQRIVKRRALAEEIVQDTFVQVWRRADSFDADRGAGRAWLYAILRNRSLNCLRDESRTDLTAEESTFDRVSDEDDPETIISKLSDAGALRRCLDKLSPDRRHAIVLAYANGLSHGELAGRLNMPLGTVKSWIRRSLMTLKECLG
jgi:RNA polymerase sigma-70 factor (ECF subfamily)